jgi:hypothetical protein
MIAATLAATVSAAAAAATAAAAVGSTYQPRVPAALMLLPGSELLSACAAACLPMFFEERIPGLTRSIATVVAGTTICNCQ